MGITRSSRFSRLIALGLLLGLLSLGPAQGQQTGANPVATQPSVGNSGEGSGTIAVTNTWQQVWPAQIGSSPARRGCLVLNNSTDRQWVYFQGPGMAMPAAGNASTIKAASVPLEPASATNALGGWVTCNAGTGSVLQDSVWITGTMGDTYVAKQQ